MSFGNILRNLEKNETKAKREARKKVVTGKEKCEMLRKMRIEFAKLNGIEFEPQECKNKVCNKGTCSVCEAELDYLSGQVKQLIDRGINIKFPQNKISIEVEEVEEIENVRVSKICGAVYKPRNIYQEKLANIQKEVSYYKVVIGNLNVNIREKKEHINNDNCRNIKKSIKEIYDLEVEKIINEAILTNQQRRFEEAVKEKNPYESEIGFVSDVVKKQM